MFNALFLLQINHIFKKLNMTINCKKDKKLLKKLSLPTVLGAVLLSTTFSLAIGINKSEAKIIESVTENISEASGNEASGAKGGPSCNKLENVSTFIDNTAHPVRAGKQAVRHWVNRCGERSELRMKKTKIGQTYWYGWSMYLPPDWQDTSEGMDIFSQWATYPTPRNGNFTCGANGSYIVRNGSNVVFKFQHKGDSTDIQCDRYTLAKISDIRGKWVDFVMQVKWTGDKDGFMKLWMKTGDGAYAQKVDYQGRTYWNDEGEGPYFKTGLYKGDPNFKGPAPRYLYTDEYRLGDSSSSFAEVSLGSAAPEVAPIKDTKPTTPTPTTALISEDFSASANNFTVESGGTWSVSSGKYMLTNTAKDVTAPNGNISVHKTSLAAGDFTLSADASAKASSSSWDDFAIAYNYQDIDNYYFASFNEKDDDNTNGVFKVEDGVVTQIANFSSLITAETTYNIKVEKTGDTTKVYRNGSLLSTVKDSTFNGGKVGFGSRNNPATFDNLKVE